MGPRDKPEGDNWNGRLRWCDYRKRFVDIVRLGPGGQRCAWERCAKPGYVCWTGLRSHRLRQHLLHHLEALELRVGEIAAAVVAGIAVRRDRKGVVEGKRGSGRVKPGGGRV